MVDDRRQMIAREPRRRRSVVAVVILAAGCASAFVAAAASTSPGPAPDPIAVSRARGKLGPALQARLVAAALASGDNWTDAELRLTIVPGFDCAGSSIEFVLPSGWTALDGPAIRTEDLVAGREAEYRLTARIPRGAGGAAAARVTAGGLSREIYTAAADGIAPGLQAGRLEADSAGNRLRVFPAGEKGGR